VCRKEANERHEAMRKQAAREVAEKVSAARGTAQDRGLPPTGVMYPGCTFRTAQRKKKAHSERPR